MEIELDITEKMVVAALDAYWGKRPYVPYKRQKWTDKEMEGMHDAIRAALSLTTVTPAARAPHEERGSQ